MALAATALVVAGCGGGGSSSTPASPTASPTVSASPSPSPSGSQQSQTQFTFSQTATQGTITSGASGTGTLNLTANGGITVASTWGANTATSSITLTGQSAFDTAGDITPSSFPAFATATVIDQNGNPLTGYTVLFYMKISASVDTNFTQTPLLSITVAAPASTTGKTTCGLFSLGNNGTPNLEYNLAFTTSTVSGTNVTFPAQTLTGNNKVEIGNVANNDVTYLAIACK